MNLKRGKMIIASLLLATMAAPAATSNAMIGGVEMFGANGDPIGEQNHHAQMFVVGGHNFEGGVHNVHNQEQVNRAKMWAFNNLKLKNIPQTIKSAKLIWNILENIFEIAPDLWNKAFAHKRIDYDKAMAALEKGLEKVVGQDGQKKQLKNTVSGFLANCDLNGDAKPVIIYMSGPSGVGKTYAAKIVAKALHENKKLFTISPANLNSRKKVKPEELFGVETSLFDIFDKEKKNTSIADYIKKTDHPVIIINEYDKMHSPQLDEIFRAIADDGRINLEGKEMDFSGTIFIITSNENHESLLADNRDEKNKNVMQDFSVNVDYTDDSTGSRTKVKHDKSFMNRLQLIEFDNLNLEDYKKLANRTLLKVANKFEKKFGVKVHIDGAVDGIAECANKLNRGSRPIMNELKNALTSLLYEKRKCVVEKKLCKNRELHVFYDAASNQFKLEETSTDDKGSLEKKDFTLSTTTSKVNFIDDSSDSSKDKKSDAESTEDLLEEALEAMEKLGVDLTFEKPQIEADL